MFTKLYCLAVISAALSHSAKAVSNLPVNVVDLGYAKYQGVAVPNTTNTQFLGIRFAAPPTGMESSLFSIYIASTQVRITGRFIAL